MGYKPEVLRLGIIGRGKFTYGLACAMGHLIRFLPENGIETLVVNYYDHGSAGFDIRCNEEHHTIDHVVEGFPVEKPVFSERQFNEFIDKSDFILFCADSSPDFSLMRLDDLFCKENKRRILEAAPESGRDITQRMFEFMEQINANPDLGNFGPRSVFCACSTLPLVIDYAYDKFPKYVADETHCVGDRLAKLRNKTLAVVSNLPSIFLDHFMSGTPELIPHAFGLGQVDMFRIGLVKSMFPEVNFVDNPIPVGDHCANRSILNLSENVRQCFLGRFGDLEMRGPDSAHTVLHNSIATVDVIRAYLAGTRGKNVYSNRRFVKRIDPVDPDEKRQQRSDEEMNHLVVYGERFIPLVTDSKEMERQEIRNRQGFPNSLVDDLLNLQGINIMGPLYFDLLGGIHAFHPNLDPKEMADYLMAIKTHKELCWACWDDDKVPFSGFPDLSLINGVTKIPEPRNKIYIALSPGEGLDQHAVQYLIDNTDRMKDFVEETEGRTLAHLVVVYDVASDSLAQVKKVSGKVSAMAQNEDRLYVAIQGELSELSVTDMSEKRKWENQPHIDGLVADKSNLFAVSLSEKEIIRYELQETTNRSERAAPKRRFQRLRDSQCATLMIEGNTLIYADGCALMERDIATGVAKEIANICDSIEKGNDLGKNGAITSFCKGDGCYFAGTNNGYVFKVGDREPEVLYQDPNGVSIVTMQHTTLNRQHHLVFIGPGTLCIRYPKRKGKAKDQSIVSEGLHLLVDIDRAYLPLTGDGLAFFDLTESNLRAVKANLEGLTEAYEIQQMI